MNIIVSTSNQHKINEIKQLLTKVPWPIIPLSSLNETFPTPIEDGHTFAENAIKKIQDLPTHPDRYYIADDSGIVVDCLDGRPGIYSARYGGENTSNDEKNKLLLSEVANAKNRSARFICVIASKSPQGDITTFEGRIEGTIAHTIQGKEGFGYDPIFIPNGYTKTLAELGQTIKNRLSHRTQALLDWENSLML